MQETYELIDTLPKFHKFMKLMNEHELVACDTETNGLEFYSSEIIGFSFSFGERANYYLPIRHDTCEKQLNPDDIIPVLAEWFAREDVTTIWQNGKFDLLHLRSAGIEVLGPIHDTMILYFMLDENGSHKLQDLAAKWCGAKRWKDGVRDYLKVEAKRRKKKIAELHYGHVPIDIMTIYACKDTLWTLKLFMAGYSKLLKFGFDELYATEMELLRVLVDMEYHGVVIDTEYLSTFKKTITAEIADIKAELEKVAGNKINLNSTKQLAELFTSLNIPSLKTTANGGRCLDKSVLLRLAHRHKVPLAQTLLEYKRLTKLRSTYVSALPKKLDALKKLHTRYNQIGAKSGRLSSANPNLQNIPRGKDVRRAFVVPSQEYIIVCIDFSQIELRLTSHVSQDPVMLKAYLRGDDIHMITAMEITGKARSEVTVEERTHAKIVNFAVLYGMGYKSLVSVFYTNYGIHISDAQAKRSINQWFSTYVGVRRWTKETERSIRKYKCIDNEFGRRRRVPEVADFKVEQWKRDSAVRSAINFVIQGLAADVFKATMVRVANFLKSRNAKTRIVMNIHDELVFYWHIDETHLLAEVCNIMEDQDFLVPILVDVQWSPTNWGDKRKLAA